MTWVSLCELDELKEGQGKFAEIDGFQLAVFLHEGRPYVIDNECPHAGGSLAGGEVREGCAVCPWHYWAFDLVTGRIKGTPGVRIDTYPTRLLERPGRPTLVQAQLPMP
jgi:nitrite reductase (NADH) small subunit